MKKIIVPIDFSENSEKALLAAKTIASSYQAEIIIIHAFQPVIQDFGIVEGGIIPTIPSYASPNVNLNLENEYLGQLSKWKDTIVSEGFSCSFKLYHTTVKYAVEESIEEFDADLVIIGRTGQGGFFDKLIGSSATSIAIHSKCPVMVVPPQSNLTAINHIVYATQLEYEEIQNLVELLEFKKSVGSKIEFLKISSDQQPDIQPDNQYIADMKEKLDMTDTRFTIKEYDDVLEGIESFADEVSADLIAVSSRERSFLEEFIINPSLTKKLILDTHIPVLIFHLK